MRRLFPLACIGLAAYLQVSKVFAYFGSAANIVDPARRLTHIDFPVLEYQMESARRFYEASGSLWGYDPFFLNGFPLSFLWNSNVALQGLGVLFSGVPSAELLKLFFVGCVVLEPFLIYAALANFGIGREARLWTTVGTLLYLKLAHPVLLLVSGMLTSYLAFPLFLCAWSLMYRLARDDDASWRLRLALPPLLALALLLHKSFLVFASPVCAVLALDLLRRRDTRRIALFCGSFAFAFAANAFWIAPALRLADGVDFSYSSFFRHPLGIPVTDWRLLLGERVTGLLNGAYLLLAVGAFLAWRGLVSLRRDGRRLLFQLVAATAGTLGFLIAFGHLVPGLEGLHAARFFWGLGVVLSVPAAYRLDAVLAAASAARHRAIAAALLLLTALSLALPNYERFIRASIASGEPTLLQKLPIFQFDEPRQVREAAELRDWLERHVAPGDNIFLSTHPGNHYLASLYAGSGLRFASAPYNHIYLKYNYLNRYFQDVLRGGLDPGHMWGGEPLFERPAGDFAELARFFNVRWWVVDRSGAELILSDIEGMTRVATLGDYEIHRYDVPMSDFLVGTGELQVDYGRIVIRNARPEGGVLVLKMHWFDGFEVEGARGIAPHAVEGLPLPFVRIDEPGPTVELSF